MRREVYYDPAAGFAFNSQGYDVPIGELYPEADPDMFKENLESNKTEQEPLKRKTPVKELLQILEVLSHLEDQGAFTLCPLPLLLTAFADLSEQIAFFFKEGGNISNGSILDDPIEGKSPDPLGNLPLKFPKVTTARVHSNPDAASIFHLFANFGIKVRTDVLTTEQPFRRLRALEEERKEFRRMKKFVRQITPYPQFTADLSPEEYKNLIKQRMTSTLEVFQQSVPLEGCTFEWNDDALTFPVGWRSKPAPKEDQFE